MIPFLPPSLQATSVECALRCLAEPEQITDYQDSLGGQQAVVHRRSTLDRLPPYLILQLKRFYNESKPQSSVKMNVNGTVNITHNDDIVCGGGIRQTASSAIIRKHLKSVNIQSKLVIPKGESSQ
ncbi:unnamed protein product [Trichobilharzia regenti]|nr:unnamed protein product [Trichobilharzia regenti]